MSFLLNSTFGIFSTPSGGGGGGISDAVNGLSSDGTTAVWGNDAGTGVGGSAKLLNNREIDFGANSIQFHNFVSDVMLQLSSDSILIDDNIQFSSLFGLDEMFFHDSEANWDWFALTQETGIQINVDLAAGVSNKQFFTITDSDGNYGGIIYQNAGGGNELQLYANGPGTGAVHIFDTGGVLVAAGSQSNNGSTLQVAGNFTISDDPNTILFFKIDGNAGTLSVLGQDGYTGSITPGQTATVQNGIIVAVV